MGFERLGKDIETEFFVVVVVLFFGGGGGWGGGLFCFAF